MVFLMIVVSLLKIMLVMVLKKILVYSLIYNEKEEKSCHPSLYVKEPTVYNKPKNHKEGDENSQWDVSLNLSNLET